MKYLSAKDLVETKLVLKDFKTLLGSKTWKTNYEWYKTGKPYGFFIKDELGILKKWNKESRTFEKVVDPAEYWYDAPDGSRKNYLDEQYSFETVLNGEDVKINLTWSQNNNFTNELNRIEDQIGVDRNDAVLSVVKLGRGYGFVYSGKSTDEALNTVLKPSEDKVDDRTSVEIDICKAVKGSGQDYTLKDLKGTFEDNGVSEERGVWLYETYLKK